MWDERSKSYRFPLAALCDHVREFRFLYEALAKSRKLDRIRRIGQLVMAKGFEQCIEGQALAAVQFRLRSSLIITRRR